MAIKTVHTSDILDYIKKCKSFELVWNENKTELLAFFTPLWHPKVTTPVSVAVSPVVSAAVSPAETNSTSDIIIYNIIINILYIIYILRRILTEVKLKIIHSPKNFAIGPTSPPREEVVAGWQKRTGFKRLSLHRLRELCEWTTRKSRMQPVVNASAGIALCLYTYKATPANVYSIALTVFRKHLLYGYHAPKGIIAHTELFS